MVLKLLPEHLQAIRAHAMSTYPDECCGILLGQMAHDGKTLVEVWATENAWSAEAAEYYPDAEGGTSRRRYAIAPSDMLKAQKQARNRHLEIIGFYHSHPDNAAIPSEFDRSCAWERYSYIIVSLQQGQAGDILSWCLDDDRQFQPEKIITPD